jgi:hypothetical protein
MKTLRWPECHFPEWVELLNPEQKEKEVLKEIREIVLRYRNSKTVYAWQVENEPFFPFGTCPKRSKDFLEKEIRLVRELDPNRPILITESGEFSFWWRAARKGDLVGISIYRKVWAKELQRSFSYFFPPAFYWKKAELIKKIFNKKVIVTEFQAEPWGEKPVYDLNIKTQMKLFSLNDFKRNIEFAQRTGFDEIYLWGGEWWYWLKTKQKNPVIWQEVKNLFQN